VAMIIFSGLKRIYNGWNWNDIYLR